ncbi:vacuolar membrane protein-domain-containing protein [Peziza echinospora]|nr:vacuolar membrane protein-domain-containing protein [Peziza echinospora]
MNTTMGVLSTSGGSGGGPDDDTNHCELLGPFALFIQALLGALALLSLVWKRSRETPQRPVLIWFFDVSKQVWGSVLVHIANLLLSMLSSGQFSTDPTPKAVLDDGDDDSYHANPCSFYLLNLGIDTTIGIFILIIILRLLQRLLLALPFPFWHTGITSGEYGDPPKWSSWGKQAIIYFCGLMGMKFVVWLMFEIFPWLGRFGDWLLRWTEGDKRIQVFFVMFFFPLVMNGIQYYIIDSYIKSQKPFGAVSNGPNGALPSSARSSYSRQNRLSFDEADNIFSDEEVDDDGLEERTLLSPGGRPKSNGASNGRRKGASSPLGSDYNPDVDGVNPKSSLPRQYPPDSESSSTYNAVRTGVKSVGKANRQEETDSLTSVILLPGSRGPSTPGYADDNDSRRLTLGSSRSLGGRSGRSGNSVGDDDSTLVGREEDVDR